MSYHDKQTPISGTVDPPGDTQAGAARPRLLDEIRSRLRLKHDSLRTEKAYLYWIRRYIHANGLRHARELDGVAVERFLSRLATEHDVARRNRRADSSPPNERTTPPRMPRIAQRWLRSGRA
jgi:hypothetical protein